MQRAKISFINRLLNVGYGQWPRISNCWLLSFFIKVGYIISWTIIISIFISHYGIYKLPILLILNSFLMILGSRIFSLFIDKIKKETLIILAVLFSCTLLLLSIYLININWELFFGLLLISKSIILSQLKILSSMLTEDLFSPMESERAFPIIESSETLGGIFGGLTIVSLIDLISIPQFIYIWILTISCLIPVILIFAKFIEDIPRINFDNIEDNKEKESYIDKIISAVKNIQKIPYLKSILIIVLVQGVIFNLLEFQYTQAINTSIETNKEVLREAQIAKSLGSLYIIFNLCALAMQLFFTSRIIQSIGIAKSIFLHQLVNLLSFLGLTYRFNLATSIITKTNYEITHNIYLNSYHSSYYALRPEKRENIKELLEGVISPIGLILGTTMILLAEYFFKEELLPDSINLMMIFFTLISIFYSIQLQKKYTETAEKNLNSDDLHRKLDAIEILGQRGHRNSVEILLAHLVNPNEKNEIKIKILKVLGRIKNPKSLPDILEMLEYENEDIKYAALICLQKFKNLGKHVFLQAFSRFRIIDSLNKLFEEEQPEKIKTAAIKILANLNATEIIPFLLKLLKSKSEVIRADSIYICGLFHDQNAAHYIEQYLNDESLKVRSNALIALWQFEKYHFEIIKKLSIMLKSQDAKIFKAGLFVAGEIQMKQEKKKIFESLESGDPKIRLHAAIALLKMDDKRAIDVITNLLLTEDELISNKCKNLIQTIKNKHKDEIFKIVKLKISNYINSILRSFKQKKPNEFPIDDLKKLKWAYETINREVEVQKIEKLIQENINITKI